MPVDRSSHRRGPRSWPPRVLLERAHPAASGPVTLRRGPGRVNAQTTTSCGATGRHTTACCVSWIRTWRTAQAVVDRLGKSRGRPDARLAGIAARPAPDRMNRTGVRYRPRRSEASEDLAALRGVLVLGHETGCPQALELDEARLDRRGRSDRRRRLGRATCRRPQLREVGRQADLRPAPLGGGRGKDAEPLRERLEVVVAGPRRQQAASIRHRKAQWARGAWRAGQPGGGPGGRVRRIVQRAVSYTHLTLPTICAAEISVVAV